MTDMPERIFAWYYVESKRDDIVSGAWSEWDDGEVAYIREDLDLLAENKALKERLTIYEGAEGVVSTDGVLAAMSGAISYLSEKLKEVEGKTGEAK